MMITVGNGALTERFTAVFDQKIAYEDNQVRLDFLGIINRPVDIISSLPVLRTFQASMDHIT